MRLARRASALAAAPVAGALLLGLSGAPALAAPSPAPSSAAVPGGSSDVPARSLLAREAPSGAGAGTARPDRDGKVRLGVLLRGGGAAAVDVERAARGLGAERAHRLDALRYLSIRVPAAAADKVRAALSRRSDVVHVEDVARRTPSYVPNDPAWSQQQPYLSAINVPAAWDSTHGAGVRIAVVDSGVDVGHPDLAPKVVGTYNSTLDAAYATPAQLADVTDHLGHGTHVAGIAAAATDNGTGGTGVGFDASVLAVKAGDTAGFSDDDISAGIVWAVDNGAKVVNLSLGGPETTTVLGSAVKYAQSHGALVVAAAGNAGQTPWQTQPSYPAALPGVVAVGATDAAGHRAAFSSFGSWVTLSAPGTAIWSTLPLAGSQMDQDPANPTGYGYAQGTSMATPVVAGQAALLLAAAPTATAAQVRSALVSSAHGYAGLGLGAGQVDVALSLSKLPPGAPPAVTAPVDGSVVSAVATLSATTTAPTVRFLVDDQLVATAAGSGGTASTSWETWALADGTHAVRAVACNAYGCGPSSGPVTVTVDNSPLAVAAASDVSGVVGVDITTADAAPKVRLVVDGQPVGAPVAVSGNAAHVEWSSFGTADGPHTLAAAPCTSAGACGPASGGVSVTLDNAAPAFTAGPLVTGSTLLEAGAAGGGVQFLLDGKPIGFDGSAPYQLVKNFSQVADGTHTLGARSCNSSGTLCAGDTGTVTVEARSLHPVVKSASPSVVSPNGDGRADRATFTYSLPSTQYVSWFVRNAVGTVVRGPVRVGTVPAGTRTVVWDGRTSSGARAGNGAYTLWLSTTATVGGVPLKGLATRGVRVDTIAPGLSVSGVTSAFFPVVDGYRDTVAPKVSVNEPAFVTLTVRNSAGKVVRTLASRRSAAGAFSLAWNGRNNAGTLQPAGTYRYVVLAQDAGLNRRSSSTYSVSLSWKRLYGTTVTKALGAAGGRTGTYVGGCSALPVNTTTGKVFYLSAYGYFDAGTCPDWNEPMLDVVSSTHQLVLPAAVKYAGIRVTVNGGASDPDFPDTADAWYRDRYGRPAGRVELSAADGAHAMGGASPAWLQSGNVLRWQVQTDRGRWWTLTGFTVRYTYYVLR